MLKVNTSFHFGKYLWKSGKLQNFKALALVYHYFWYTFGRISAHELHQKSFELLFKGEPLSFFEENIQIFAKEIIKHTSKTVLSFLEEKKRKGATITLLSTGPEVIVKAIGSLLGFDQSFGTSYALKEGRFTEVERVIDGKVKGEFARVWVKSYKSVYAITDSIQDLPLLEAVTHPMVANPDSRLRREAVKRGYPIL